MMTLSIPLEVHATATRVAAGLALALSAAAVDGAPGMMATTAAPGSSTFVLAKSGQLASAWSARYAPAGARLRTVQLTNCDDHGPGSLREALETAHDFDAIDARLLSCSAITLTTGSIAAAPGHIVVVGPGATTLAVYGNAGDRVITQNDTAGSLELHGMTIARGYANSNGGCIAARGALSLHDIAMSDCHVRADATVRGGAIYASSDLYLDHVSIVGSDVTSVQNDAVGGAISVEGELHVLYTTISGNNARGLRPSGFLQVEGGGIWARSSTTIEASTISGNTALGGGGLSLRSHAGGQVVIVDSTVSGNRAEMGSGIYADTQLTIFNSTIAFNCASNASNKYVVGAGLQMVFESAEPELQSSIIANNIPCSDNAMTPGARGTPRSYDFAAGAGSHVGGAFNLIGSSNIGLPEDTLIGVDPMLAPLANNGGPTRTHALLPSSPAIGAGSSADQNVFDQRGVGHARTAGVGTDMGSFEVQGLSEEDRIFADDFEPADPNSLQPMPRLRVARRSSTSK